MHPVRVHTPINTHMQTQSEPPAEVPRCRATLGDTPHYYLCTFIKGEGKLFINHPCPRGPQKEGMEGWGEGGMRRGRDEEREGWGEGGMWVTGRAAGLVFLRQSETNIKPGSFIITAVQTHQRRFHWSCSASVDTHTYTHTHTHTHTHPEGRGLHWRTGSHNLLLMSVHKHTFPHTNAGGKNHTRFCKSLIISFLFPVATGGASCSPLHAPSMLPPCSLHAPSMLPPCSLLPPSFLPPSSWGPTEKWKEWLTPTPSPESLPPPRPLLNTTLSHFPSPRSLCPLPSSLRRRNFKVWGF